jgi:hypothetical protein
MTMHHSRCDLCRWYRCEKTPRPDQSFCEWPYSKFEKKE